jgi:hypothetical protein
MGMAELHPRARRFAIKTPIHYREAGGTRWFDGTTENISWSGVLFRTDQVLELKTAIQMSFSLPVSMCSDTPGQIHCRGAVVRLVPNAESSGTTVAATIRSYRLVRGHQKNQLSLQAVGDKPVFP